MASPEHALETIKNIVDLNIKYNGSVAILEEVNICTNDTSTFELLQNYYGRQDTDNIKFIIEFDQNIQ